MNIELNSISKKMAYVVGVRSIYRSYMRQTLLHSDQLMQASRVRIRNPNLNPKPISNHNPKAAGLLLSLCSNVCRMYN